MRGPARRPGGDRLKSLVFWAGGPGDLARRRRQEGATLLLWDERAEASLQEAAVPFEPARRGLGPEAAREIENAVRTWARVWGRRPLVDGRSFRELFEWKGTSLWWMAESFFRTSTEATACVRQAETFLRILEVEAPQEVESVGLPARDALLLERAATARGVLYHGRSRAPAPRPRSWPSWLRLWWRRPRPWPPARPASFVLVADPDGSPTEAPASETMAVVPLAALRDGETATARRETAMARHRFDQAFRDLQGSPGVHEAFTHRGVPFYDLCARDLRDLLRVALPRAVHLFEQMASLLGASSPQAVALRVASRDERRTLLAACHSAGVPTVLLRTEDGEEPERLDGGPQPDLVLAWNGSARPEDLGEALREAVRASVRDA